MNPRFTLKDPKQEFSSVVLRIYHAPHPPFKYYLKAPSSNRSINIPTSCWNEDVQEPKSTISAKYKIHKANLTLVSSIIKKIKGYLEDIKLYANVNEIDITNNYLTQQLDSKLGVKTNNKTNRTLEKEQLLSKPQTLVEYYDSIIIGMKDSTFLKDGGNRYEEGTIESHITCKKGLYFFDYLRGHTTCFEDINIKWYNDYLLFLVNEQEVIDKNGKRIYYKEELAPGTIGSKHIKNVKFILRKAWDYGITQSMEFNKKYFKRMRGDEPFSVALSEKELENIYQLKLIGNEDIVRDLFLVACYTALRYSDFSVLKPHNFKITDDGTEVLDKGTYKTKEKVLVPILWKNLKAILKKYDYNLPTINSIDFNEIIKGVAKQAGITQIQQYWLTKGGKDILMEKPRNELIASHTGRRTFATNMVRRNYAYQKIMLMTGHTKLDSFERYVKFSLEENANDVAKEFKE